MKDMKRAAWLFLVTSLLLIISGAIPAAGADVIIDNGGTGTTYTGTWGVSSATNPYGSNSLWSRDGDTYTWTFAPAASGSYELSTWWTTYASRSSSVPVDIENAGGTTRVTVDQLQNGGQWNVLGTYSFTAGNSYRITVTSQPGPSSTSADAVRFVYISGGNIQPVITSTPVTVATINDVYTYDVNASGYPQPSYRFAGSFPSGMTINAVSGVIQWTPGAAGMYPITVEAYNAAGTDQQTFTLAVAGAVSFTPDWTSVTESPFHLTEPAGVTNPVLTVADVTDTACEFVADPFLFHENGEWYLFFEAYVSSLQRGTIGLARSIDGLHWTYDRIVLANSWHNSYPLVFKADGKYYMVPESFTQMAVHLYEAADFPYSWTRVATLVSGKAFVDPSIFRYNGVWWMFVSDTTDSMGYLYYSDNLLSGWTRHPKSPFISSDKSSARPGGRSFVYDNDRIIRLAQKNDVIYGEKVRAFQVDLLTKTDYAEHEIPESPVLSPSGSGWNRGGMHQFDPWWTGDHWLVAVDGNHSNQGTDEWSIGIYTTEMSTVPVISSAPVTTGVPGTPYSYDVNAGGSPAPSYELIPPIPTGMTINEITGLIQWTPASVGAYAVTVRAVNAFGTDTQTFSIAVSILTAGIVDNGEPGTSYTGSWGISGASSPYGSDSFWSRDGDTYTWTFTPTISGSHEISMWWTTYSSRSSTIPVDIQHADGTARVVINQLQNGGKWNVLGTYSFVAGKSYKVTITSQPGPSSTCADAVRFAYIAGGNVLPVATIDSISPNPATPGQPVAFTGHGTDVDGSVVAYDWQSSLSGTLSSLNTFSTSTLAAGSHTISFRVQDNNNTWSAPVNRLLVVGSAPEPSEVIIDNGGQGTSSNGSWGVSGAVNPYGSNSLWSRDGDTYTWTFTPAASGSYELSMWWTAYSSRSSSVPVDIGHAGGTSRVVINQLQNGGKWNLLGTYVFTAGTSYRVTITSQPGPSSTCADAVKFTPGSGPVVNIAPVAVIDSLSPNPALPGEIVTFTGHGTDSDGTIGGYSWRSSLDGLLSESATFVTSVLSSGNHIIYFKVKDDKAVWSSEAGSTLSVQSPMSDGEHIYVCLFHDWEMDAKSKLIDTLRIVGATQEGEVWKYVNSANSKTYIIHIIEDMQGTIQALYTENAHIIIKGHANYGLGAVFPESSWPRIYDIFYVDDDKILNFSSPWIPVSIYGMIEDQSYPNWWPIFKDGTSGIMPYDFNDPKGDPAYNYYATYRVPGDPTYYKVETVHNSAIERFPDSGKPAWYSPAGAQPSPSNPDHLQYYITNPNTSFEPEGKWMEAEELPGYFGDDYCFTNAGNGTKRVTWNFTIPAAGYYNISAWWPASGGNTSGAPYTVTHASGSTTVRVDQRTNGEIWNMLGQFYFGPGAYSVTLSDNVASGNIIADAIHITHRDDPLVLDMTMDNLKCPKTHYRSKTILSRKALEVDISKMKYTRMLFDICSSGVYLLDTFHRGLMFYTLNSSDGSGMYIYLKAYLEGKSDSEIWQLLQQVPAMYDYYDFSKTPTQQ
ncbi:MAG: hypothetical protein C0402_14165 [Thermodesulfovibrio sp.]|nr:hypothetical protein [Thermodesulfovibrio sp.]